MRKDNQFFNGYKFYKRSDNFYWYSTIPIEGKRRYMHKLVWSFYNGEIPKGYEIHHKDLDRDNNDISNLELLTIQEHKKLHSELNKLNEETVKKWKGNIKLAIEKAKEWHKSEEGINWHKTHAKNTNLGHLTFGERECEICSKKYVAKRKCQKYCSNNCRAKALRQRHKGML